MKNSTPSKEINRYAFGNFNVGLFLNEASRRGYMGPKF